MTTHEPECPCGPAKVPLPLGIYACICDRLRKAYREGYSDHARTVQHWQDTHGAYRAAPDVVIHQCPPDGAYLMPCCGASPFERMGDRMTLEPGNVTCTGRTT